MASGKPPVLVIGCGNRARGDDGAGPVVVQRLLERGLPGGVEVVDAGTGGIDVVLHMRGARRVVIVDAGETGAAPGSVHRLDGADVEALTLSEHLDLHRFRWDHALALGRQVLGDEYPEQVVVYLVEGGRFEVGMPLSPAVDTALEGLVDHLLDHELARTAVRPGPEQGGR